MRVIFSFYFLLIIIGSGHAQVIYVDSSAIGLNNGNSWGDAYLSLQDALKHADTSLIDTIWVSKGTYYPDEGNGLVNDNINQSFTMVDNVGIYAGFSGVETSLIERDWVNNRTILSGEIQQDGDTTNNSRSIIRNDYNGLDSTAILDGFIITLAYSSNYPVAFGGGVFNKNSSPLFRNCEIKNNILSVDFTWSWSGVNTAYGNGAGFYNDGGSPRIINCKFNNNSISIMLTTTGVNGFPVTDVRGGGFYTTTGNPILDRCSFNSNKIYGAATNSGSFGEVEIIQGAGVYSESGNITIINCEFKNNSGANSSYVATSGGAVFLKQDTVSIINCSFTGNLMKEGGAISMNNSVVKIYNSILWGNIAISTPQTNEINVQSGLDPQILYCYTDGINFTAGIGNILDSITNPYLDTSSISTGLTPYLCSLVKNAGKDSLVPTGNTIDLLGNNRFFNTVDIGAYEIQSNFLSPVVNDTSFCEESTIAIVGQGNMLQWFNDGLLLNLIGMGDTLLMGGLSSGLYTVYVVDSSDFCPLTSADTVEIMVNSLPNVNLGVDTIICTQSSILLDAGIFLSYFWNDNSSSSTLMVDGGQVGVGIFNYTVQVIDSNNCANVDSIVVEISDCVGLNEISNSELYLFFPNPVDDVLHIEFSDVLDLEWIKIYNQVGEVIYGDYIKGKSSINLETKNWPRGLYYSVLSNGMVFKVVKN